MKFESEHVNVFIKIFNESAEFIQAFEGCLNVELLKDINQDNCYFTISKWVNEDDLNKYRSSDLFRNTWSRVKPLFSDKAEAWSLVNESTNSL